MFGISTNFNVRQSPPFFSDHARTAMLLMSLSAGTPMILLFRSAPVRIVESGAACRRARGRRVSWTFAAVINDTPMPRACARTMLSMLGRAISYVPDTIAATAAVPLLVSTISRSMPARWKKPVFTA